MPQPRPPKRPNDASDGSADSAAPAPPPKAKQARVERGPEEFSNVVKSKLQSYTRTGQACDRCKVSISRVALDPFRPIVCSDPAAETDSLLLYAGSQNSL